jgi:Mg2+ and Co2+ transporter CorA
MTQTTQDRSLAVLNEPGKNSAKNKSETEDNAKLLLTVYDNLNELYERLNKLSNIIGRSRR